MDEVEPAGRWPAAHAAGSRPGPTARTLDRWRRRLADEREEAKVYRDLAGRRTGEEREILLGLAEAEARHAAHWAALLGDDAGPTRRGSVWLQLLALLARRFGSVFVLALVQRSETRSPYWDDPDATPTMAADERIHEEVVRGLAVRDRSRVSGTFRAAVFGANDGLVSNLALVLGVFGGGAPTGTVLLTGLAGLLAGALSMGAGEFVSVRSQRELLDASAPNLGDADLVLRHLDVDLNELELVYRARGMPAAEARTHAEDVLGSKDPAGSAAAAQLGGDGNEHVGTGTGAALSSLAFFASGAAVPIVPFVAGLSGYTAILVACVLVGLALMLTGAVVGVLSGASPLRRALRQLAIGAGAAGVTYGVGLIFGAARG